MSDIQIKYHFFGHDINNKKDELNNNKKKYIKYIKNIILLYLYL